MLGLGQCNTLVADPENKWKQCNRLPLLLTLIVQLLNVFHFLRVLRLVGLLRNVVSIQHRI